MKDGKKWQVFEFSEGDCDIPKTGFLSFFFIDADSYEPRPQIVPVVHFVFGYGPRWGQERLSLLIRRARREPGDNIIHWKPRWGAIFL